MKAYDAYAAQATESSTVTDVDSAETFSVLLVECFAGSHPVAKIARQINQTSSATGLRVAAYVGIELNPWKRPTPTAEDLGLSPDRWLGLYGTSGTSQRPQTGAEGSLGNVADFETQGRVLEFLDKQFKDNPGGVDAVLVFGGPPCCAYSKLKVAPARTEKAERAAYAAYLRAIDDHRAAREKSALDEACIIAASQKETETWRMWKAAIAANRSEIASHSLHLSESDELVQEFINLFKRIEAKYGQMPTSCPCYLIMENPMSTQHKGLWSRPFMLPQLKNLPQRDVDASTLSRWLHRQNAWLNVVLHHWCGYDHTKYPQKPTTIFTNLDCLPPMPCCRQTRQALGDVPTHSKNVKDMGDDEKAAWPTEFVEVAIRAAVEEVAVMKAKKLAMKKASAITRNLWPPAATAGADAPTETGPTPPVPAASAANTNAGPSTVVLTPCGGSSQRSYISNRDQAVVELTTTHNPQPVLQNSEPSEPNMLEDLLKELDACGNPHDNMSTADKLAARQSALNMLGCMQWTDHDDVCKKCGTYFVKKLNQNVPVGLQTSLEAVLGFDSTVLHAVAADVEVPVCLTAAVLVVDLLICSQNVSQLENILANHAAEVLASLLWYAGPDADIICGCAARSLGQWCIGNTPLRNMLGAKQGLLKGLLQLLDGDHSTQVRQQALSALRDLVEGDGEDSRNQNISRLEADIEDMAMVMACLYDDDTEVRDGAARLIGLLAQRASVREMLSKESAVVDALEEMLSSGSAQGARYARRRLGLE